MWMPVRCENHIKEAVTRDESEHSCTKDNAAEDMSVYANLEPNVHTRSEKEVVLASNIDPADACACIFTRGSRRFGNSRPQHFWFGRTWFHREKVVHIGPPPSGVPPKNIT